jgi:hypothetical protein
MAFQVLEEGTRRVSVDLGTYGTVQAHTGARINASGELVAEAIPYFWIGEARIGLVQWICSWRSGLSLIALPRSEPFYEQVDFYTGPPSDGPTDADVRRLMGQWQREDRLLLRRRGRR